MTASDDNLQRLLTIQQADTMGTLAATLREAAQALGASGFAIADFGSSSDNAFIRGIDGGLGGWVEHYAEHNLVAHCAIARQLTRSRIPFTWDQVRRASADDAPAQAVFEAADGFGVSHGMYFPMAGRRGLAGFGFLKLDQEDIANDDAGALALVAVAGYSRLDDLVAAAPIADSSKPLSAREADILTWFSEGKSADDIAVRLGISLSTVMFHYRQVAERYGTLNRTHTVVKALQLKHLKL